MDNTEKRRSNYLLCLKEFKIGAVVTALFIFISSLISYMMGYNRDPQTVKLIMGFPDWVFWGIIVPWVGIVTFTFVYGMFIMEGDEK